MGGRHKTGGPKAVLWDLDGTLVDSERENAKHLAGALVHGLGIKIDEKDKEFMIGKSWVDIHKSLQTKYQGFTWNLEQLIEGVNRHIESLETPVSTKVLPGAHAVLDVLVKHKVLMAVVTGSSRGEAEHALQCFDQLRGCPLFAAEDVPTSKPDPLGYQMAADLLKVPTSSCLVFEDSLAGISAAKSAGCRVVAVEEGNFASQDQSLADVVIDSLESVSWSNVCLWMG